MQLTGQDFIAQVMSDAGLPSHAELSRRTGKATTQISRWANGKENPRPTTMAEIARKLGLDPSDYGAGDDDPTAWALKAFEEVMADPPEWFKQFQEQQATFQADIRRQLNTIERKLK